MPARVDGLQHTRPVADANFEHTKEEIAVIDLCPLVARTSRCRVSSCGAAVLQHCIDLLDSLSLLSKSVIFTVALVVAIASSRILLGRAAGRSVTAVAWALIVGLFRCLLWRRLQVGNRGL